MNTKMGLSAAPIDEAADSSDTGRMAASIFGGPVDPHDHLHQWSGNPIAIRVNNDNQYDKVELGDSMDVNACQDTDMTSLEEPALDTEPCGTRPDESAMEIDEPKGFDISVYKDYELPKRELRPQHRANRGFQTTWIDTDESGNYDPESAAQEDRRQKHRRAQARDLESTILISGLAEIMHFASKNGQTKFKQQLIRLETQDQTSQGTYRLRRRRAAPTHSFGAVIGGNELAELPDDLTGYPVARGCYSCAALSNSDPDRPGPERCSLLDDERSWPCEHCYEDEHDCEIITAPIRKKACEACKGRREACSFVNTRNHGKSCLQCARVGHPCVAGPLKDYIRPRIRYDRDWEEDPYPRPKEKHRKVKQPEACGDCRDAGRECSYRPDADGHYRVACIDCLAGNLPCTILTSRALKLSSNATLPKESPPKDEPAIVTAANTPKPMTNTSGIIERNPRTTGSTRTISTSFAHPIAFNCDDSSYSPTPQQSEDQTCHFCTEPSFAAFGFGQVEVEVIAWKDNPGYQEISAGHTASGTTSTRLCTVCTASRMSILTCDKHDMRPILGIDTSIEAQEASLNALFEGTAIDMRGYCAVCPRMAIYECAAVDETMAHEGAGCGLRLCEGCALTLEGEHDGDLGVLLEGIDSQSAAYAEVGLRADMEFLRRNGSLTRFLRWLSSNQ